MDEFSVLSFLVFLFYIKIGSSIYRDNINSKQHKLFFMLCLSLALWSFSFVFIYSNQNIYVSGFLLKVSEIGKCSFSAILLHFILRACKSRFLEKGKNIIYIYIPTGIVLLISWFFLEAKNVKESTYITYHFLKNFYYIIYTMLCVREGFKYLKQSKILREKKVVVLLSVIGIITITIIVAYDLSNVIFRFENLPNVSHMFSILWIAGIWYSFKKYSFLNIQAVLNARSIFDKLKDLIIILDCSGDIVSTNLEVLKITGYNNKDIIGQPINNFIEGINIHYNLIGKSTELELINESENRLITKTKQYIPVSLSVTRVLDKMGEIVGAVVVGQDMRIVKKLEKEIEENRKVQKELSYLSYHDSLTGLYNRTSFENKMRQLETMPNMEVGIIICDLDGLKLINDTLGHKEGDEFIKSAAEVIPLALKKEYLVARIGGDEFSIIIENVSQEEIKRTYQNICKNVADYNNTDPKLPLSMSIGYALRGKDRTMKDVFKEADNNMYREKLLQSRSTKDAIVRALIKTLKLKDFILQGHADRVFKLMVSMAEVIGLPEYKINDLWLMAQFHDIGKVGVSDSILYKPTTLDFEEFSELKRHCEIGYRIARSSPELEPIAEYILRHHEWWNGNGYPLGLKGEEIPIECRLFSIIDAYDVMTTERPYKKVLCMNEAINELEKCRGSQFDPKLVAQFVEIIKNKDVITA